MTFRTYIFLLVSFACIGFSDSAYSYGTLSFLGQDSEHQRITRRAYYCEVDMERARDCMEPLTLDKLAGKKWSFGGVGRADRKPSLIFNSAAHCDNGDFFNDGKKEYPQSKELALESLLKCRETIQKRFEKSLKAAKEIVFDGKILQDEVKLNSNCIGSSKSRSKKCVFLTEFGMLLHALQDFYSHSNWSDVVVDPDGLKNPPGIGKNEIAPWLKMPRRDVLPPPRINYWLFYIYS